jgi:hypothetical protein
MSPTRVILPVDVTVVVGVEVVEVVEVVDVLVTVVDELEVWTGGTVELVVVLVTLGIGVNEAVIVWSDMTLLNV